jgi:hypothetical protein
LELLIGIYGILCVEPNQKEKATRNASDHASADPNLGPADALKDDTHLN